MKRSTDQGRKAQSSEPSFGKTAFSTQTQRERERAIGARCRAKAKPAGPFPLENTKEQRLVETPGLIGIGSDEKNEFGDPNSSEDLKPPGLRPKRVELDFRNIFALLEVQRLFGDIWGNQMPRLGSPTI